MLKTEVQRHLETGIIPFWESMKDEVYGGFYGFLDYGLNQIGIKIDMYRQEHRFSPATPVFRRFDV